MSISSRAKGKKERKKGKNILGNFSRVSRDLNRPHPTLNIGTETKRSQGGPTTHGRPLLEYLWRLGVRDEFLSIRPVGAPSMPSLPRSLRRRKSRYLFISPG